MPNNNHNEYYSVITGFLITFPTIFSSWGDVHPLINGFPKAKFQGFKTLDEAKRYMDKEKVPSYQLRLKGDHGATKPERTGPAYYAVANGHNPGIRTCYRGDSASDPEVLHFPGACYKRFRTKTQAEAFIQDWIETFACVAKSNIRQALLDGHRPSHMQEWSLQFELKPEEEDTNCDALIGRVSHIRLIDGAPGYPP